MAYEPKPGNFSLFKNDKKEKDTHPDYKGDGVTPDGTPVWVSAWLKDGTKGKFMSCSMQPKEQKPQPKREAPKQADPLDDDIPW
jgi:hypothetical protein